MRRINITQQAARSASGAYIKPDFKVWQASEFLGKAKPKAKSEFRILAFSKDVEDLEDLFPTAHNEHKHMVDRKTNHCTNHNCWRSDHAG